MAENMVDNAELMENSELSEEEKAIIIKAKDALDFTDTNQIIQYGSEVQSKIADFSDAALEKVRNKDLGEVGESLTGLITELKGFNALEEKKGIAKLFHKAANPIEQLKTKYAKASTNVEKVTDVLEGHQVTLTKDVAVLDELFDANKENYKQLSYYITAGKERLEEELNVTLPAMKAKAEETGLATDAQAANDYQQMLERFEKKIYDLELTKEVSLQMAPQIRLVQNNDTMMIEKIQTALVNTIPLWKSQLVLALGLANSEQALSAQKSVTDATNELLLKNAEILQQTTVGIAQESERGIVDIETLQATNGKLIDTIDEVMRIQAEGHEKRQAAEQEIYRMDQELKAKLLQTQVADDAE